MFIKRKGGRFFFFFVYKEKQKYYKERAKQENMFWISKLPLNTKSKEKGMTYVKPKEDNK